MKRFMWFLFALVLIQAAAVGVWAEETALDRYVAKPDDNYSYYHYHTVLSPGFTTYFLTMTSQQWRTLDEVDRALWEHEMEIYLPWNARWNKNPTAILLIDGGSNGGDPSTEPDVLMGFLARMSGSVLAIVKQVPNQPLYFTDEDGRGRTEDEILAYSLDKFLVTGDEEWPVHLAMTKAAVRAMDTIQSFLLPRLKWISDFVVVGGSKRGWTTWLTAAVDNRVKAIAPISIDILNIEPQIDHHWEAYGFYAPAIEDYVEFDIFCRGKSPEGAALMGIIDPYSYRDRYTMPKLVINSAGDQFFLSDSSQFYFDDLPGPKVLRYSLNTDHSQDSLDLILSAISWVKAVLEGKPDPEFSWTLDPDGSIRVVTVTSPKRVLLWQATNPDARDFRLETIGEAWTSTELHDTGNGVYIGYCPPPPMGWTAFTVEITFHERGLLDEDQVYTTDVRVTPDYLPYEGTHCK